MGENTIKLDAVDLQILKLLQEDGKRTAKQLAEEIGLTQTPVYERVKKLEKSGVIDRYVAILDPSAIQKDMVIFLSISLNDHAKEPRSKLLDALKKIPQLSEIYHTSGAHDFLAKVRVKDIQAYRDFLVKSIGTLDNIKDITSHIVLDELKSDTAVYIDDTKI